MKKKLLISVVSLISMFGMTACGGETSSITSANNESSVQISDSSTKTSESSATTYTGIAITNKEELTAEWHVGEAQRKVNIDLTPAGNVNTLIQQGLVSVTSDHTDVVQVIGTMLSPVGAGEANITVKVGEITDTVKITVADILSEPEYVTDKTFAEITADGLTSDVAYVAKFKVSKLGQKDTDTSAGEYGNLFVTAEDGTGTPILVYGASTNASALKYDLAKKAYTFTNPKDFSINADTKDIAVGTVLTGVVIRADYKGTKELNMVITAVDNKTVANGVLDTDAVQEVKNSKVYSYQVSGKITKWTKGEDGSKYGNFYIKSEGAKGEELQVYGATATASALTNNGTSNAFTNPQDFLTSEATKDLKVGDDVTMLAIRCDYKETIEVCGVIIANIEPAQEPAAVNTTIAELCAKTAPESDKVYNVTGIWEGGKNDDFGNGYLTDPATGDTIQVFGATKTASALAFDGSSGSPVFTFTNPKDSKTWDVADGQLVTMKAINCYYASSATPEIKGIITSNAAAETKYTASSAAAENGSVALSKTTEIAYGEEITITPTANDGFTVDSVTVDHGFKKETVTAAEGVYKFKATVKNVVTVTFTKAETNSNSYVFDVSDENWPTSAEATATEHVIGGYKVMTCGLNKDTSSNAQAGGDIFFKKGTGYMYNAEALPGAIQSIKVTFSANSSAGSNLFSINSGSSALTTRLTTGAVTVTKSETVTYTPTSETDTYFQFSTSGGSKNIRVTKIVVAYLAD